MNNNETIACLCVTHNKPSLLERAINCFFNQRYDKKQMVIVYEDIDLITEKYLNSCNFPKEIKCIKAISSTAKLSLGELRNLSISHADGSYVCQWDDDDWFHPNRLSVQMSYINKNKDRSASILARWTIFDSINNEVYISNRRLWEGSIMCQRDMMLEKPYPSLNKGEDTSVIDFLNEKKIITVIEDYPELYVYNYHGENTWDQSHFNKIFEYSNRLDNDYAKKVKNCMNNKKRYDK